MSKAARRVTAPAVVGVLGLLCLSTASFAQTIPEVRPVTHLASIAAGTIQGVVQDERGAPVSGAMISAFGATTAFAVSDRSGRFEIRTLSPGPYLVRAHLTGFVPSRGQVVDVRPSGRTSSSIALRRANNGTAPFPVLTAGVGEAPEPPPTPDAAASPSPATGAGGDDHSDVAWRLRHARRGVLKDATLPLEILPEEPPATASGFGPVGIFGRASESSARLAADFFGGTPFSGQLNLLTTGSFDSPQQLFSGDSFSHSTAYFALGAPVGEHADWTARAALTQGDLSSWIVAGEYTTRAPARHRYDVGLSYSTQRYEGGNFATLRDVTDGSRNAGAIYAFDTFSMTPSLTLTYGMRYARYDYLEGASLVSPRVALTLAPSDHFRVSTMVSSRATAPGAEEFMPRIESGIWLPPQRTFSSLVAGQPFEAERANHVEVEMERDIASATVTIRGFHQHVSDQLATIFGLDMAGMPSSALGHYFLTNVGSVDASGMSAGVHAAFASRLHGSVEYTLTHARLAGPDSDNLAYLLVFAPSAVRPGAEQIHDVATSIETDVPETATRVVVLYRVSNAFAHAPLPAAAAPTPSLDTRFDVQVRQSLPFMDFSSAKWEMLVAVRNFFREASADQSVYDELLVVRPPKRIVGGLTLKF
jgi:TonB-dependent receptor-like protein/carboxypeptidase family protein